MKVLKEHYLVANKLLDAYKEAALQMTVECGIHVNVKCEMDTSNWVYPIGNPITHIYFEVDGHEFESLKELRTAINNKAFL